MIKDALPECDWKDITMLNPTIKNISIGWMSQRDFDPIQRNFANNVVIIVQVLQAFLLKTDAEAEFL
jgi:hypothetical protein